MGLFGKKTTTVKAFRELGDLSEYRAIATYGIVNPFGPTMIILATTRDWRNHEIVPVVLIDLHPFSPMILRKWTMPTEASAATDKMNDILDEICNDEELGGGCPTLLIPGAVWGEEDSVEMLVRIVSSRDGGKDTFDRCKRFVANAFDRVTDEVQSMLKEPNPEKLSYEEAKQFVELQIQDQCFSSELSAFRTAYNGAINFAKMLPVELSYDDFWTVVGSIVLG